MKTKKNPHPHTKRGEGSAAVIPVAIAVSSPLSRSLSPSSLLVSTPQSNHSRLGAGALFVPIVLPSLRLFPLSNVPILVAHGGCWGCWGGGGRHRPRRSLAVVVVVQWRVLGRPCHPCLRWCPYPTRCRCRCPHPVPPRCRARSCPRRPWPRCSPSPPCEQWLAAVVAGAGSLGH
jgi:hypothetical protein